MPGLSLMRVWNVLALGVGAGPALELAARARFLAEEEARIPFTRSARKHSSSPSAHSNVLHQPSIVIVSSRCQLTLWMGWPFHILRSTLLAGATGSEHIR